VFVDVQVNNSPSSFVLKVFQFPWSVAQYPTPVVQFAGRFASVPYPVPLAPLNGDVEDVCATSETCA
jgi:hypothetical protein